ncbi:hypothetical protein KKC91_11130 [bacterium]|nr:hypothetical protein [bacterium]
MIISPSKLKKYAKEINPNMRISKRYIIGLEIYLQDKIEGHVKRNKGKKTLLDDVFLGLPARKK